MMQAGRTGIVVKTSKHHKKRYEKACQPYLTSSDPQPTPTPKKKDRTHRNREIKKRIRNQTGIPFRFFAPFLLSHKRKYPKSHAAHKKKKVLKKVNKL